MVRHMCQSPLLEVLGSFAINALCEKLRAKYPIVRLLVCALIRDVILCEFQLRKIFTVGFPGICW